MHITTSLTICLLFTLTICAGDEEIDTRLNLDELIPNVFTSSPLDILTAKPPTSNEIAPTFTGCDAGYECTRYFQCNNESISKDGAGLIDIRFDSDVPQSCAYLRICCTDADTLPEPKPILPPVEQPKGCGYRNPTGVGFTITGNTDHESQYGEFPWMIAVLEQVPIQNKLVDKYIGGGSLIHPSVVLTAAHAVAKKKPGSIKARAGEWDTQTTDELYSHQDSKVIDIVIHEGFNDKSLFNDFALLFLETPFKLTENIQPICLPPPNMKSDNSRCYATGWGKDIFGKAGKYQAFLKKIDLPVVPRDTCQDKLRTTRLSKYFELHSSFICAGGEKGKDTCKGDGGSPLACPIPGEKDRYYQAGIVAWGIGCGDELPGVYADVAQFRNWIDEQLAHKKIDASHYTA